MKKIESIFTKVPVWFYVISLILFGWNYKEIVYQCKNGGCSFLKNMGIKEIIKTIGESGWKNFEWFFHSLYHNIEDLSLVHAASFFSLFAMVIALIQAIYPYRLGEVYGYPIARLKSTFNKQKEIQELIACAFVIVVAELLKLHILEAGMVAIGYVIIGRWIYEIVGWYGTLENIGTEFIEQFKENLSIVLSEQGSKPSNEQEIYELIERLIKSGGVEERRILEAMACSLYQFKKKLNEDHYQKIFELSFFMAQQIIENNWKINDTENSWNFKMLKESILKSGCEMGEWETLEPCLKAEEAFIMGTLCGCLTENNRIVSRWCIYDVLSAIHKKMRQKEALEITGMLLVFLELYCNMNQEAIYSIDMMIEESYVALNRTDLFCTKDLKIKMEQFYKILLRLNLVEAITEYDLIETLSQELEGRQTSIPKTMFGVMKVLSGN